MEAVLPEVKSLVHRHGRELCFVVNHSGGKDSNRMLGLIRSEFPDVPTQVVMADTGFEHVSPISAADFARARCADVGLELTVVRNRKRTYLEMVEQRGKFPSPQFRQCTSDLKRGPIEKFVRSLPYKVIVNCMGIRSEESSSRANLTPFAPNQALTTRQRTVFNWLPIFDQTLQDVLVWHWSNNVPLHPVYVPDFHADGALGGFLRRLSCRVCIFATDKDLAAIQVHDPSAFDQISRLEEKLRFTMRPGVSLVQIVEAHKATLAQGERQQSFCFG